MKGLVEAMPPRIFELEPPLVYSVPVEKKNCEKSGCKMRQNTSKCVG